MHALGKSFLVEIALILIAAVVLIVVSRHNAGHAMTAHMEAEKIAQAKRLFGDSWRESLKY